MLRPVGDEPRRIRAPVMEIEALRPQLRPFRLAQPHEQFIGLDRMQQPSRRARRQLGLSARDAVAALNLVMVIPEDAGRQVWTGELSLERGAELCAALVTAALEGLAGAGMPR